MDKVLYKSIIKYYSHLKIVTSTWNEVIVSAKEVIKGLKNRCEQLRLVTSDEADKTEIYKLEGLKEKLILKIFRGIQDEIELLGSFLNRLNSVNQELKNKLTRIEEARSNVSLKESEMQQIINGTPFVPRLEKLLIWSIDSQNYFQSLYETVHANYSNLDYKMEISIENLEKSFQIDYFWTKKLDCILRLTETLSKTNVS